MGLIDLIEEKNIKIPLQSKNKKDVIRELVDILAKNENLPNPDLVYEKVMERESKISTGLVHGIAIPHGKCEGLKKVYISFGIQPEGIDFEAVDGGYSFIFFLVVSPKEASGPHVKALSAIANFLQPEITRKKLVESQNPKEAMDILSD